MTTLKQMCKASPYTNLLASHYGDRLTRDAARVAADSHGLTLGALEDDGLTFRPSDDTCATLDLVLTLGY